MYCEKCKLRPGSVGVRGTVEVLEATEAPSTLPPGGLGRVADLSKEGGLLSPTLKSGTCSENRAPDLRMIGSLEK